MSYLGDRVKGGSGSSKSLFGNLVSFQKEIGILKHKMLMLSKEMDQLSKKFREEWNLGQHIDKLLKVIGDVEEVKNLMHKIPVMEEK